MNRVTLLEALKEFTEQSVSEMILPVRMSKGDTEQERRHADVYLMRLPDGTSATKYAPYILHQIITGHDFQQQGKRDESNVQVRTIFCVYSSDEQEGGLMLLELMERLRIAMLKQCTVGNQFLLDKEQSVETMVYTADTAPYFAGEMITTWQIPPITREVNYGQI